MNNSTTSTQPLYLQLCKKIQNDIMLGYLKKDNRLPSIRKMAENLNLSRTTVETAYQQLCMEGYVYALANRGYYIQMEQEDAKFRDQLLSTAMVRPKSYIRYDFSSDTVDPLCFDLPLWKRYMKESLDDTSSIYSYGDPQGEITLRNALQRYTYTLRGVLCNSDQIVIGTSFQSLLQQLCSMLPKPQKVAMEECGFLMAEQIFNDYDFEIIKIPMQEEGLCIEFLNSLSIDVLYLNSAAVGTLKKPLPIHQRKDLLKWSKEKHVLIIEDDHNGELRYVSKHVPALQGIDTFQNVIYIGSFSKLLIPSLRIGYMVLPLTLTQLYLERKPRYGPTTSKIEQIALAHYILDGHLERQIRKSKKRYEYKYKHMIALCEEIFINWQIILEETALRIHLRVPQPFLLNDMKKQALHHYIRVQISQDSLVLSFTNVSIEDMKPALTLIKQIWADL